MIGGMIKAILFDLGGVLFTDGTKQFIAYLHDELGVDAQQSSNLLSGQLGSQYREGKIGRNKFWETFKQELDLTASEDELEQNWISGYRLNEATKSLIQELSRRYDVYYLSDNVQERIDVVESKYHFLNLFKDGIFSHVVGVRKPNPRIYKLALEKVDAEPSEVVFIDDKASALEPARELGMKTILFEDAETVRQKLAQMGV